MIGGSGGRLGGWRRRGWWWGGGAFSEPVAITSQQWCPSKQLEDTFDGEARFDIECESDVRLTPVNATLA